ncbi:MAG: hypothetical protein WBC44_09480 [Planctomycetaceae bacterium]
MTCIVNRDTICHVLAVGDTLTPLGVALKRPDGTAVDLTGKTVKVYAVDVDGTEVIAETGTGITVTDDAAGEVQYDFQAADVATAREFYLYFRVYSGTERERFPPDAKRLVISVQGDV